MQDAQKRIPKGIETVRQRRTGERWDEVRRNIDDRLAPFDTARRIGPGEIGPEMVEMRGVGSKLSWRALRGIRVPEAEGPDAQHRRGNECDVQFVSFGVDRKIIPARDRCKSA